MGEILSIDPGTTLSAYTLINSNTYIPVEFGKIDNCELLKMLDTLKYNEVVIEMISSYGFRVGRTVFDTCVWIGRFTQKIADKDILCSTLSRLNVKMNLCGKTNSKDTNVIAALKMRFGEKGTSKEPGFLYGFKADIWQAFAVGVTYIDIKKGLYSIS